MNKPQLRIKQLRKTIDSIHKPYPDDNLITSYKDFIKYRDYLINYKFNSSVFISLVRIANERWSSEERTNRLSLLESIKVYGKEKKRKSNSLRIELNKQIFSLFRKSFEETQFVSVNQIDKIQSICNSILIDLELTEEEENWLCKNADKSSFILNRVLRYPKKTGVISSWAKLNYTNDKYRNRRSELTSWVIDTEPEFEIEVQTLMDDFNYMLLTDINTVKEYESEMDAIAAIQRGLKDVLPKTRMRTLYIDNEEIRTESVALSYPELVLPRRPYSIIIDKTKNHSAKVPDFEKTKNEYATKINMSHKIAMLWAIAYSRHDGKTKANLMKKYYSDDAFFYYFKIARRFEIIETLEWLIEKQ
jgi:hypothetical protein